MLVAVHNAVLIIVFQRNLKIYKKKKHLFLQLGVLMSQAGFQPRAFKIENLDGAAKAVRTMVDDSGQVMFLSWIFG